MAVSVRSCGVCGGDLNDGIAGGTGGTGGGSGLGTIQLSCKHLFHLECIRWAACRPATITAERCQGLIDTALSRRCLQCMVASCMGSSVAAASCWHARPGSA
jgi:hypothetical protein